MLIQDLIEGTDFKEQKEKIFTDALNVVVRKEIESFIEYYINMVTLLGVKHLSTLTDNKELFEETLNKAFDAEHQKQYINEVILKDVRDEKKVDMIAFFKGTYERLKIDTVIRQELYKNYIEKEQKTN